MNRKQRRARSAQAADAADRRNEFGSGRPDRGKRRPQRPKGNARAALLRRLRRDHPQLHALVLDGTLSPFRAAVTAGFRKPPGRQPKHLADPSDPAVFDEMRELWLGGDEQRDSLFNSPEELRAAWLRHRDEVMKLWGQNGRRPRAWWEFETELEYPGYDAETLFLRAHGLLSAEEERQLAASAGEPPDTAA